MAIDPTPVPRNDDAAAEELHLVGRTDVVDAPEVDVAPEGAKRAAAHREGYVAGVRDSVAGEDADEDAEVGVQSLHALREMERVDAAADERQRINAVHEAEQAQLSDTGANVYNRDFADRRNGVS